ncbi:uncharacterized protein LOC123267252 [Cotesia glomerata]|uniref:uncharacterized protein LOC123267252 n=1 Tax=Cotesia glomerata TaxID=32391 RepID=UPI001D01F870|nr:uncharacterized protein LOC123267252 [Cotesia glomerata]
MEFKFSFFTKLCILFLIIENLDVATGIGPLIPVIISAVSLGVSIISMSLSADTAADRKNKSPTDQENQEALMNKLEEIRSLIGQIDANSQAIQGISSAIQSEGQHILEQLSLKADKEIIQEFFNVITHVDRKFKRKFLKYAGNLHKYHNTTIDHYLEEMIDEDEFKSKLEFVVDSIVKTDEERLLGIDKVLDVIKGYLIKNSDKYLCGSKSLYDQMFGIYNLAVATLVKGYTMIGYAYNIRRERLSDPNAFKQEMLDIVKIFKEAAIKITQNARHYIYAMDKVEYEQHELCDPEEWKEGENYFRLKNCLTTSILPFMYSETLRPRIHKMIKYPQILCPSHYEDTCTKHDFTHFCVAPPESGRRFWSVGEKITSKLSNHKFNEKVITLGIKTHQECVDLDVFTNLTGTFKACTCVDERVNPNKINTNLPGTLKTFTLREHFTNCCDWRTILRTT